jgi:hypothetical protein
MVKGVKAQAFKMTGEVKADVAEALSLFDMLRDTIGFFVVPFLQLANILPQIYDPMLGLIDTLIPLRKLGAGFALRFHGFAKGFEDFAKEAFPDVKTQAKFLETRGPRAALRAMVDLLHAFDSSFVSDDIVKELLTLEPDFGKIGKTLITGLLDSPFMEMVGETIGFFVSELLTVMADLLTEATDFATSSKFAQGLVKGLEGRLDEAGNNLGMGAFEAIQTIFNKVFEIMGKLLLTAVTKMPMQIALFVGITAVLPAALAALGTKIGIGLSAVLSKIGSAVQASLSGTGSSLTAGRLPGPRMPMTPGPKGGGYLPAADKLGKVAKTAKSAVSAPAGAVTGLAQKGGLLSFFGGAGGKNFVAGLKAVSPKLLIFGGVLSAIIALFEGKGIVGALAAGLGAAGGSAIGAAIGTVIFPGVGTAIGAAIGGWVGTLEIVTQPLTSALGGLFGAIEPLGGIIGQLWNDVTGVINGIITWGMNLIGLGDKLGEGFNLLQFALFALLSPFKLLQIGIMGIYEAYLEVKRRIFGLSEEEKTSYNKVVADRQKATDEFTIEGRQASGFSLQQQRAEEYKKFQTAKTAGNTSEMNRITQYLRVIDSKIAGGTKPTTPSPAGALTGTAADQATTESATTLKDIDKKQKEATSTLQKVDDSTKRAVVATSGLSAKFNAPIAVRIVNLPTMGGFPTFSPFGGGSNPPNPSIFNDTWLPPPPPDRGSILPGIDTSGFSMKAGQGYAGGNFNTPLGKVLTASDGMIGPSWLPWNWGKLVDKERSSGQNKLSPQGRYGHVTDPEMRKMLGLPALAKAGGNFGGTLMEAIKYEMKHKPSGSSLVIANSSETIIPAANGLNNGTGNITTGPITISIDGYNRDPKELTDSIASELLTAIYRKSRSEVLTS